MISSKTFAGDGSNKRFLSDFIIRSEQFCRVYNYVYDSNGVDGDVDPSSGLYIRVVDKPKSGDLVTIDKWDLVDNSISFYTSPYSGSRVYIEVATTSEEFGDTLIQPAVERAETAADAAEASEVAAAASEAAAALSESAAALSETNAAASAAAALASQNAAALSESNASASETAAGLSEAAAALSEAAAQLAETNSETAQAAAEAAQLAAETAQGLAETAQTASETAQGLSEAARDKAELWAEEADNVAVEAGKYSAKHWANVATQAPAINTFKNKIIDGNMDFWHSGTSFVGSQYGADMWASWDTGYTKTNTRQGFVVGELVVPHSPKYYNRVETTVAGTLASHYNTLSQHIEYVSTLANKEVTLSFWARTDAGQDISVSLEQHFGTGGTPSATVATHVTKVTTTTGWVKYEATVTLPSINGKTLGTGGDDHLELHIWLGAGSDWNVNTNSLGNQIGRFDIAQVQLEEGSVATPFEDRPKGLELSLCQRYYWASNTQYYLSVAVSTASTLARYGNIPFPVVMRTIPTQISTAIGGGTATASVYKDALILTGTATTSAHGMTATDFKFDARL